MFSGPISADKLAHCDEMQLYYGFDGKPDYEAALQCGWYERAHPQPQVGNMFYGPGVLTMLYANGLGIRRHYDLALRFACEQPWASETEFALRVGHIEHLRDNEGTAKKFDLCDDITSGLNQGTCALVAARAADAKRDAKLNSLIHTLSPEAQAALPALRKAEKAFEESRVKTEIDLSGTARAVFQFSDQTKLHDQFLINLERFGRGDIPPASTADVTNLERQLNEVYQQIQNAPPGAWEYGTVQPEGIRKTQRAWLALARAWEDFAKSAYPTLSPERVRAQLIRLRLH
jgi:uncharacterized protein YecT (DUF1311 family)